MTTRHYEIIGHHLVDPVIHRKNGVVIAEYVCSTGCNDVVVLDSPLRRAHGIRPRVAKPKMMPIYRDIDPPTSLPSPS